MTSSRDILKSVNNERKNRSIDPNNKRSCLNAVTEVEAIPVRFPPGLPEIMLDYLGGNVVIHSKENLKFKLFNRKADDLIAERLALLIRDGGEKEAQEALELVTGYPAILLYSYKLNCSGNTLIGTFFQITAMLGDIALLKDFSKFLSPEVVQSQMLVVNSNEAKTANKNRNKPLLSAIKKFKNALIKISEPKDNNYQFLVDKLDNELEKCTFKITLGFASDPMVLIQALKWHGDLILHHDARWTAVHESIYQINVIGKLQKRLSSFDKRVAHLGVGNVVAATITEIPRMVEKFKDEGKFERLGKDLYLTLSGEWANASQADNSSLIVAWRDYVYKKQPEFLNLRPTDNVLTMRKFRNA